MDASELENWNADGSPGVVEGDRRQDDLPHKDSEPKPKEQKPQQTKQTLKPSTSQGLLLKRQLPQDVWERMKVLNENSQRNKQRVIEKLQSKISQNLERQLSDQKRLQQSLNPSTDNTDEVCLPALFMPTKLSQVYTPKAHLYFNPTGSTGFLRLTQPPSILNLPPIGARNKLPVLSLMNSSAALPVDAGTLRNLKTPREEERRPTLSKPIYSPMGEF
ncbi:uncharacterized protein LOC102347858 [Latimeria chalumnae]|uniref:uncharacterized protein LOC102347858 n=1 Tax=Latimeria chalumnae TaxID=7897 RepID=UPI00313D578A